MSLILNVRHVATKSSAERAAPPSKNFGVEKSSFKMLKIQLLPTFEMPGYGPRLHENLWCNLCIQAIGFLSQRNENTEPRSQCMVLTAVVLRKRNRGVWCFNPKPDVGTCSNGFRLCGIRWPRICRLSQVTPGCFFL